MRPIPTITLQALLYRCFATTVFICLLVVINLFYQFITISTPIRDFRVGGNPSNGSVSLRPYLKIYPIKGDNRMADTMEYCYNPTAFNSTEFRIRNDSDNSIQLHPQQPQDNAPKIIWLMSFPNSGTTYTLKHVQGSTLTTTATNYGGNEQVGYNTSISIDQNRNEFGPFFRYPDRPYSCHGILTKTHCHQDEVLSNNVSHFMNSCRMGNRNVNGTQEEIVYAVSTQVHSAVHLIRNPFDNIVARMHYKIKQWLASNSSKEHDLADYISFTPEGLLHWCQYVKLTEQKHYYSHFNSTFWATYMEPTPCAIEFYKYFHWHHYTTEGIRTTLHDPSMILYYEDYTIQYNATTNRLLNFLQLKRPLYAAPPEFIVGKTYTDWFTNDMKESVKRLALVVVSDATWKLLHHYFVQ
jgi:Sulfotransferase domain